MRMAKDSIITVYIYYWGNDMKKCILKLFIWVIICITCIQCQTFFADSTEKTVRVGVYEMEGFHSRNEYGDMEGYCIDYLNVIADVNGWKYEYVEVSDFTAACKKLEKGEIDLLAPVIMTDARKENFDFSEIDLGMEYTVLVTTKDKEELYYEDYASFNGMKVAVLYDYPLTEFFIDYMKTQGFEAELVYFNNVDECKRALHNGEVDAMVNSIMDIEEYKLLARFSPKPFYFMTYKENTKFLGELNQAMKQIQNTYPTLLDELLVNYYPIYELQFYTRENDALRVAYVTDRKPLSFTNENGELDGISRAIFDRISELSGLEFEYVELPAGDITYDYLVSQEIDLLTGVEYNSANMNAKGIFMSRPYMKARKVMVSKSEFVYEPDANYKLGIIAGSQTFHKVVKSQYPNLEIVNFETMEECFKALYDNEIDILMQNLLSLILIYIIENKQIIISSDRSPEDLKILEEKYSLGEVSICDMFPFTHHAEVVTYLTLK